jgi:hypothetical protein
VSDNYPRSVFLMKLFKRKRVQVTISCAWRK